MKHIRLIFTLVAMALALQPALADDKVVVRRTTNVSQLEEDIRLQEDIIEISNDSIKVLEGQIAVLKLKIDSLKEEQKAVESVISDLNKLKKSCNKDIDLAKKTREATFAARDQLVFEQNIQDVLKEPYDRLDVDAALRYFDTMETKDVIKRKELLTNYGKYTKDIRDFLEDQRKVFKGNRWTILGSEDEAYKNFQKKFKKLNYYKIYEKGQKDSDRASIPYLDKVMNEIQILMRSGFNNERQYDRVLNMVSL